MTQREGPSRIIRQRVEDAQGCVRRVTLSLALLAAWLLVTAFVPTVGPSVLGEWRGVVATSVGYAVLTVAAMLNAGWRVLVLSLDRYTRRMVAVHLVPYGFVCGIAAGAGVLSGWLAADTLALQVWFGVSTAWLVILALVALARRIELDRLGRGLRELDRRPVSYGHTWERTLPSWPTLPAARFGD